MMREVYDVMTIRNSRVKHRAEERVKSEGGGLLFKQAT